MTYKEAYDKIIDAYFKNGLKPLDARFCICGTLCDGSDKWFAVPGIRHNASHGYKGSDFVKIEKALIHGLPAKENPVYEKKLFDKMSAALDVLKEIHRSRGEDVDSLPATFTKRVLA